MPGHHHAPFELGCWGDDDSHLHALFMCTPGGRYLLDDPPPALLHGKKNGQFFRPNVTFQIGRCWTGPWKTIGRSHIGDEALKIDKGTGGGGLEVQLDIFRPHLRSGKCGRVVLESGEGEAFKLDIFFFSRKETVRRELNRPNQALERTAARRVFTFHMIKTVSVEAARALGAGRSNFISLDLIAYDHLTNSSFRFDTIIAGYLCSSYVELRVWAG